MANNGLEFLFLEREGGWLDTPKGHIEKGESAEAAARRELREETGLVLTPYTYFMHQIQYFYIGNKKEKIRKTVKYFMAEADSGAKVKISDEHVGYKWLTTQEMEKHVKFKTQKEVIYAANDYAARDFKLKDTNNMYAMLTKRNGWDLSKRLVPGEGPANAKILVLGQAPGQNEDEKGRPFIGRAGQLLDHLLRLAGIRRESVYITSVVQFFPPKNRMPTKEEVKLCEGFLDAQIDIIKPKLIIALGNLAAEAATGTSKVKTNHGKIVQSKRFGCKVFVTLHPAAAVRIRTNMPIIEKDFRDLKAIAKKL